MRQEPKRCPELLNSSPKRFELHVDLIQLYALIWHKPAGSKCCKSSLTLSSQRELIKLNLKHDFAKINQNLSRKIIILTHFLYWGCPLRTQTYDKCNVNVCENAVASHLLHATMCVCMWSTCRLLLDTPWNRFSPDQKWTAASSLCHFHRPQNMFGGCQTKAVV